MPVLGRAEGVAGGGLASRSFSSAQPSKMAVIRSLPLLALAAGLVACGQDGGGGFFARGGTGPTQPVLSTDSLAPKVGCTHVARLLNDRSAPLSEVLRRWSDCPPEGTPGWILVRDEQAYRNYQDIGRNVRGIRRPPP